LTFFVKYGTVTHNREKEKNIMKNETYEYVEEPTLEEQIEASVKEGITLGLFKDLSDDPTFLKFEATVNEIENASRDERIADIEDSYEEFLAESESSYEDEAMLASLLFAGGA
jgi:hypothetical protein